MKTPQTFCGIFYFYFGETSDFLDCFLPINQINVEKVTSGGVDD